MNSKKNLVLLGMMGSGKSTLGYLLSKRMGLDFIDIDNVIEEISGMSISKIFEKKGEEFFRDLEEKITKKILRSGNRVVSLGGGAFINKGVRNEILDNHVSFWLNCSEEILLKRIRTNNNRPLANKSTDKEIKDIIKKRNKVYAKAKFKINCNKQTKNEIVNMIMNIYGIC